MAKYQRRLKWRRGAMAAKISGILAKSLSACSGSASHFSLRICLPQLTLPP